MSARTIPRTQDQYGRGRYMALFFAMIWSGFHLGGSHWHLPPASELWYPTSTYLDDEQPLGKPLLITTSVSSSLSVALSSGALERVAIP